MIDMYRETYRYDYNSVYIGFFITNKKKEAKEQ